MTDLLTAVDEWCQTNLPARPPALPLQLLNVRPTHAELAAHPQPLNIQAYFAGARHAADEPLQRFPRPLTEVEAESWADGWAEHHADAATERPAHTAPLHLIARKAVA